MSSGNMATFVPVKTLLEKHATVIETCILYPRLVELVMGFATSPGLKKTDNRSLSYDCFSDGVSLSERRLPHAKSKAKLGSPLIFP